MSAPVTILSNTPPGMPGLGDPSQPWLQVHPAIPGTSSSMAMPSAEKPSPWFLFPVGISAFWYFPCHKRTLIDMPEQGDTENLPKPA